MAKVAFASLALVLALLLRSSTSAESRDVTNATITASGACNGKWCIADPNASTALLGRVLEFICFHTNTDCSVVAAGKPCSKPDTLQFRASVLMNIYYKAQDCTDWSCNPHDGSGLVVTKDPSTRSCHFP